MYHINFLLLIQQWKICEHIAGHPNDPKYSHLQEALL